MKKAILGRKVGMTQMFLSDGTMIPVTVIEAGPCPVVQKKTVANDGYDSIQVGFAEVRETLSNKPMIGHFAKAGVKVMRYLKEYRLDDASSYEVGQVLKADVFAVGDRVDVSGKSKGHGFQGTIKRYGAHRGPKTHGSKSYRVIGSRGSGTYPGEVFKTKKMPGHMGSLNTTVQNLEVVRVDADRNLLLVKGAIPGAKGTIVSVKNTVK